MGNNTFADRIKKLRTDKNLTLDRLAKELNINKGRIACGRTMVLYHAMMN